jgi:hypothetical protein
MLSDAHVLEVWDRGQRRDPIARGLALLQAVRPELGPEELAGISIPERDAAILALRQRTFGAAMPAYVDCPRCGERLEFEFDSALLGPGAAGRAAAELELPSGLRFRLPNSGDLMAARGARDAEAGARLLARRCCLNAAADQQWSDELLAEIERALAAADPGAEVRLELACPACAHAWVANLDVTAYLWEELEERAQRLLDDVHCLASWYGWSESQILALSEPRRRAYLDRCEP